MPLVNNPLFPALPATLAMMEEEDDNDCLSVFAT